MTTLIAFALFALMGSDPGAVVLPLTVTAHGQDARGSCVLVQQDRRDHDVVLYFVTAASLFRSGDEGGRFDRTTVSRVAIEGPNGVINVEADNVFLPAAVLVDVAVLKVVVTDNMLIPLPLDFSVPSVGESFAIATAGNTGQIVQNARFRSTLLLVGDRALTDDRCIGAPALSVEGVFGIVTECAPNRNTTISLLAIARPFLVAHIPDMVSHAVTDSTILVEREALRLPVEIACGQRTSEVDVPLVKANNEVPVFATATFLAPRSLPLGELTVLGIGDRTLRLRFTMEGERLDVFRAPCQPWQALVSVRVTMALDKAR